ncbi:MAG: helix-turn-helix domain-containing protein [Butyrivibrio sp.]|nr:helix-turn-helix domain-containing protein [Butyrivibrio sp.]
MLTNKHHISNSTLHRLKHNKDVSAKTLNDLCRILDCQIGKKKHKLIACAEYRLTL